MEDCNSTRFLIRNNTKPRKTNFLRAVTVIGYMWHPSQIEQEGYDKESDNAIEVFFNGT